MIVKNKQRRFRLAPLNTDERLSHPKGTGSRRGRLRVHPLPATRFDFAAELAEVSVQSGKSPLVPIWKRVFDSAWVVVSLPFAIPLMLLVALWIRLVSRGPALFRQERVGLGGRRFTIYKFRSMYHGSATSDHQQHMDRLVKSGSPMTKLDLLGDSRLIPGGCFLRTAGLDELPQLLNVLRGEMSLVGPRPCLPQEFGYFDSSQRTRFAVLPGLTGRWQISGKNRATFNEMNAMDLDYVRMASPSVDLGIMARTPMALLRQMGECMRQQRLDNQPSISADPLVGYSTQRLTDRS